MFPNCVQAAVVASHRTHLSVTICLLSTWSLVHCLWLITLLALKHYGSSDPFTTSFTEQLGVFTTGSTDVTLLKLDIWCFKHVYLISCIVTDLMLWFASKLDTSGLCELP